MISASPHLRSLHSQSTAFIILRGKLQIRQSKELVWIRSLFLGKPCLECWVQASHWLPALILQKMALKCAWHPFSSHQTRKSKRRWPHGWIPFGQAYERSNLYAVSMHSSQIGKEVRKWSLEGPGNRGRQPTGAIVLAHHVSPTSRGLDTVSEVRPAIPSHPAAKWSWSSHLEHSTIQTNKRNKTSGLEEREENHWFFSRFKMLTPFLWLDLFFFNL